MGFLWCPFCKNPHLLSERTCPITGQRLATGAKKHSVQVGSLVEQKYLLKSQLGSGAYGVVYAAENVALGGQVALKFLGKRSKDAALRFEQEARIANSLSHPNICRVFDVGSTKSGTPFFVMELLAGMTLGSRIGRGRLDVHEATGIISQVLSGLGAAHAKGVIHRDIKPENIFLEEREGLEPVAKILDFGLAKLSGPDAKVQTAKGIALGTILYMSPEQMTGLPVGVPCDIFATAVVLYEAIAGVHPFLGASQAETAAGILRHTPAALSTHGVCSVAFGEVVAKALEKNAAARHGSVREFQVALHRALDIVERPRAKTPAHAPEGPRLPNLGSTSDHPSVEVTQTIPNAIYHKR